MNFFNAGIQTGLGPFIATYLCNGPALESRPDRHRSIQMIAGVLVQSYTGHRVDRSEHKRTWAFATGLLPEEDRSKRIGRNETYTHGGNVVFAVIAGIVGKLLALGGIFIAAAAFASGMAVSSYAIREEEVDQEFAREGGVGKRGRER